MEDLPGRSKSGSPQVDCAQGWHLKSSAKPGWRYSLVQRSGMFLKRSISAASVCDASNTRYRSRFCRRCREAQALRRETADLSDRGWPTGASTSIAPRSHTRCLLLRPPPAAPLAGATPIRTLGIRTLLDSRRAQKIRRKARLLLGFATAGPYLSDPFPALPLETTSFNRVQRVRSVCYGCAFASTPTIRRARLRRKVMFQAAAWPQSQ
jgi:hypothetical protein